MKNININNSLILNVPVIYWMASLAKSDSYYIIYLIIGLCALINNKSKKTKREKIVTIIFSIVFSLLVSLANYQLFQNVFDRYMASNFLKLVAVTVLFLLNFVSGIVVFYKALLFLHVRINKISNFVFEKNKKTLDAKNIFVYSFLIIVVIDLFVLFFLQYPGVITTDSINQIEEILTGKYTNMNPYWHTMLVKVFFDLGISVFGKTNAGVAMYMIFQILVIAFVVAFSNATLVHLKVKKIINVIIVLFFTIVPFNLYYSVTLWKDVLFGIMVLLFVICSIRILNGFGNKIINYLLLFVGGFGSCLLRNNGLYAFITTTIILAILFFKNNKCIIVSMFLICIVSFVFSHTFINKNNIGESEIIESLAIPIQQIARVLKECDDLSVKEIQLIDKVADHNKITAAYVPYICDNIKIVIRENGNQQFLKENIDEFAKLYVNLGLRHPLKYIAAWIDQTKGYFNGGYNYWIVSFEVNDNNFGIKQNILLKPLSSLLSYYELAYREINLLQPIVSIGLHFWYMLVVLYLGIINKNKKSCFSSILLIMIVGTLIVASPVYAEFRYAYSLFTCSIFVFIYCVYELVKNKESSK